MDLANEVSALRDVVRSLDSQLSAVRAQVDSASLREPDNSTNEYSRAGEAAASPGTGGTDPDLPVPRAFEVSVYSDDSGNPGWQICVPEGCVMYGGTDVTPGSDEGVSDGWMLVDQETAADADNRTWYCVVFSEDGGPVRSRLTNRPDEVDGDVLAKVPFYRFAAEPDDPEGDPDAADVQIHTGVMLIQGATPVRKPFDLEPDEPEPDDGDDGEDGEEEPEKSGKLRLVRQEFNLDGVHTQVDEPYSDPVETEGTLYLVLSRTVSRGDGDDEVTYGPWKSRVEMTSSPAQSDGSMQYRYYKLYDIGEGGVVKVDYRDAPVCVCTSSGGGGGGEGGGCSCTDPCRVVSISDGEAPAGTSGVSAPGASYEVKDTGVRVTVEYSREGDCDSDSEDSFTIPVLGPGGYSGTFNIVTAVTYEKDSDGDYRLYATTGSLEFRDGVLHSYRPGSKTSIAGTIKHSEAYKGGT